MTEWGPDRSMYMRPSRLVALAPSRTFGTGLRACLPRTQWSQACGAKDRSTGIPLAVPPRAISSTVWWFAWPRRLCQVSRSGVRTRLGRAMSDRGRAAGREYRLEGLGAQSATVMPLVSVSLQRFDWKVVTYPSLLSW